MLSFNTDGDFKDNYKFLIGAFIPRPISLISTINRDGSNNVAPFSFSNAVSAKPMIVSFCPLIRTSTGEKKDTLINIEREQEFVLNFVTEDIAHKVNNSSTELPYGEDEFEYAGLTPLESEAVKAKRVQESPIHFECRLKQIISFGDCPGNGTMVLGEVLKVHIEPKLYDQGRIDTDQFRPIGRGAGNDWILCDHRIQLERQMQAQIQK